jgi:glycosyltransferase involved in cell wall biosynthesis
MKHDLTVVVPAYKASMTIQPAIERIVATLEQNGTKYEIIVVIDGEVDDTKYKLESLNLNRVSIISYPRNMGKGYALRTGFEASAGELVGLIDADLDIHPSSLVSALTMLAANESLSGVVGSKFHIDSDVFYPKLRVAQSKIYSAFIRLLFGLEIQDTQTGVKVFRREALLEACQHCSCNGFAFDLELLVELNKEGYILAEFPVELEYQFNSTVRLSDALNVIKDTFHVFVKRYLKRKKH